MPTETEKFTTNINKDAMDALRAEAKETGVEVSALIQRFIHKRAISTKRMNAETAKHLDAQYMIIDEFVALSKELFDKGMFDEHFVLTVFKTAMTDQKLVNLYELAIDGKAFDVKVPGKTPLNMYLGWYIKNAIGAEPKLDDNKKPLRIQIRDQPIQSYTLLSMPT